MAHQAQSVWAAKGKKQVRLSLSEADDESLTKAMVGPSGNLRAPTLKVGRRYIVGFQEDLYREVFGVEA